MKKAKAKARAKERVRNGAAFLDVQKPQWRRSIEVDELEIDSGTNCILGQLFGTFTIGVRALGLDEADKVCTLLGFYSTNKISSDLIEKYWIKEVKKGI